MGYSASTPTGGTDWGEVTAWATIALAVVTGVLAIGALWTVRVARKTLRAQLAADFSRRWDDLIPTRQKLRHYSDGAALKQGFFGLSADSETDDVLHLLREADYFEDLAILVERDDLDYGFVRDSLGDIIVARWKLWADTINEMRSANNGRDNYPHFRALAATLSKDEKRS